MKEKPDYSIDEFRKSLERAIDDVGKGRIKSIPKGLLKKRRKSKKNR